MKRLILLSGLIFLLFHSTALASPPKSEIDQILTEVGWSEEDLVNYLAYYELSLDDFDSSEEIRQLIGSPISNENVAELLVDYDLSRQELDLLLSEFGETVDDYTFIEDLAIALTFYLNHESDINEFREFFTLTGLTDKELETLFSHFIKLKDRVKENEMDALGRRMEAFQSIEDMTTLSHSQKEEVLTIFSNLMTALGFTSHYYLKDTNGIETSVNVNELFQMDELYGNVLGINLYNTEGEYLVDFELSEEMVTSQFLLEFGRELTEFGTLAGALSAQFHSKLPETASSLWINLLAGIFIIGVGIIGYFLTTQEAKEK
ncbi:processed acidic surface protein [Bacillus weihaiensis]|uniref:Processed acidic surface protein n=1 Tax=Bacillus weihaiensis TaxID=1547283 RepID=A0A1L3MTC2_9BACI|nr:processed acidic surface protein [Bacillus weihaiensis]APH05585.1 processed acidic surface protein [Bacillus weihaiensis]